VGLELNSLVSTIEELLGRKVAVWKTEITAGGIRHADHATLSAKFDTNLADKRLSLGGYRSRTQDTEFVFFCFGDSSSDECYSVLH
jgi:hypothetical protein